MKITLTESIKDNIMAEIKTLAYDTSAEETIRKIRTKYGISNLHLNMTNKKMLDKIMQELYDTEINLTSNQKDTLASALFNEPLDSIKAKFGDVSASMLKSNTSQGANGSMQTQPQNVHKAPCENTGINNKPETQSQKARVQYTRKKELTPSPTPIMSEETLSVIKKSLETKTRHGTIKYLEQIAREIVNEVEQTIKHKEKILQDTLYELLFSEYWLKPFIYKDPCSGSFLSNLGTLDLKEKTDTSEDNFNIELISLNDRLLAFNVLIDELKHNDHRDSSKQLKSHLKDINSHLEQLAYYWDTANIIEETLINGGDSNDDKGARLNVCNKSRMKAFTCTVDRLFTAAEKFCIAVVSIFGGQDEDLIDQELKKSHSSLFSAQTENPVNDYFEAEKKIIYIHITAKMVPTTKTELVESLEEIRNPVQLPEMMFVGLHHLLQKTITKYLVTELLKNKQQDISIWIDRVKLCSYLSREILGTCKPTKCVPSSKNSKGSNTAIVEKFCKFLESSWLKIEPTAQKRREKLIRGQQTQKDNDPTYKFYDTNFLPKYYFQALDAQLGIEPLSIDELVYIFELSKITKRPMMGL